MSKKSNVINPNENSHGFMWAMITLIVIIIAVIGYIVWANRGSDSESIATDWNQVSTNVEVELDDESVVITSENTKDDATVVEIYEDFSCQHCAELATATDADMLSAIEDGDIIVHIRDLNFMDRGQTDGNSNRVGASAYALAADGDANAYWNLRAMALEEQTEVYNNFDLNKLADAAAEFGASDDAVSAIRDFKHQEEFAADAEANADRLEAAIGSVSSPHVFINGEEVDSSELQNWVSIARETTGDSTAASSSVESASETASSAASKASETASSAIEEATDAVSSAVSSN
ncbi:MAG: thioredoxin domain-containing protein [Corynebacterium sp.]|nr:thioredoxin domain-containing protein [Corynebacterium sp.]